MPSGDFSFFMEKIVETVRASIAECAGVAYASLSVTAAQKLLMLDSREELYAFINSAHTDWLIEGDTITFQSIAGAKSAEVPSKRLISEALSYATELERIV